MINRKENVLIMELIKLTVIVILCWLLWIIIFAFFTPEEYETVIEPFRGASFVFGLLTGIIVDFIIRFNKISVLKQKVNSSRSNIDVLIKRGDSLLVKANKVADKYMTHEKEVMIGVAKERNNHSKITNSRIRNATQFEKVIENYPELKANTNIMELLNQIRESENNIAHSKILYNDSVTEYNSTINGFPGNIIKRLCNYKEEEYFKEEDNMISDEALGI